MDTWGERVTVPFPFWSILTLCPLVLGRRWGWPAFSATNGQLMLFRKDAYTAVGGHFAVRYHAADDLALGRRVLRQGLRWAMHDASDLVTCRMYGSLRQALLGFAKNYFPIFDYRVLVSILVWPFLVFVYSYPLVLLSHAAIGVGPTVGFSWLVVAVATAGIQLFLWLTAARRFCMPTGVAFLYPIIIWLAALIGWTSMVATMMGKTVWKGRSSGPGPIRWL